MTVARAALSLAAGVAALGVVVSGQPRPDATAALGAPLEWRVDSLTRIGGHAVEVVGDPRVVGAGAAAAVAFDGVDDGLVVAANPLAGLGRFTLEVDFRPASGSAEEQRFFHAQEDGSENRALVELRMRPDGAWALDTYLQSPAPGLPLLDRSRTHSADVWHTAALIYDGRTMTHTVDGVRQGQGEVAFSPLAPGRTSLGMRLNRVSFFKGEIRRVRVWPEAVQTIPLWPEGVPGRAADLPAEERWVDGRVTNVQTPGLCYLTPTGPETGTAVVVAPGGGYARLAMANEAAGVAERLRREGVGVFVLKYRVGDAPFPAPLQDVLRAVRLVRSRADEFGVRADRVGVMGASAGGHVAAMAGVLYDAPEGRTGHVLDRVSARPDFLALLYPVVLMEGPFIHRDSTRNLIGESPTATLVARTSADRLVQPGMPPVFLVHTAADRSVPLEHSLALHAALRRTGVPTELHLYEQGEHGFGVRGDLGPTSQWMDRWMAWMRSHGWLPAAAPRTTAGGDEPRWGRGFEGQRRADLGDGTFLNPIVSGDHPDPSVLKDGDDYYMTFSSFDAYPGLVVWHSRDLVNWTPIGPALRKNVGAVWAPDLVKHGGRYYIYFPGIGPYRSNYVVWADDIRGPWSDPIDLKIGRIDPGHAVGPDGRRYLFLSAGYRVPLAADGLSVTGPEQKVYGGWPIPPGYVIEGVAQEGPKILRRGDYYYMVLAQGGTAGPPTGHMIVAARSRSIDGPWEHSPHNPIVRTRSADEAWWSKGHGTLVEDGAGRWWMVYHAYERGYLTLGRQTLLEPVEWTRDGWFRVREGDPAQPIVKPAATGGGPGRPPAHGFAFSDGFATSRIGVQWSFYAGDAGDASRVRVEDGTLTLRAKGDGPATSTPLWFTAGDRAYEIEVDIDADPGASAGLLLFYSRRLYAGLGFSARNFFMHSYGLDRPQAKPAGAGQRLRIRLRNDRHILTMYYSVDGERWERYDRGMELSGYHHNVAYEFSSLRPALYAAGAGEVRFRDFRYRALP